MKYTIIATPGPERYEVAKFFWLEDAFEYHVAHGDTELFYSGERMCRITQDDRVGFVRDPSEKIEFLNRLSEQCIGVDEREWKRTHPQPWEGQPLQVPPMRSFGDPNWYPQGTTAPKEYYRYVTVGDSVMKKEDSTGGPSSIANM